MKLPQTLLFLLTFLTTIHALALPAFLTTNPASTNELFKRKGGGGGGGRGGGGGSSGGKSGSSSSGSSSSGSSSSGSRGGSTSSGSGTPRAYGSGGGYYGGGAATPYRAGPNARSPGRGIAPYAVGGAALVFFPALALYGAYAYNFGGYHQYYNETSRMNESLPMTCYCGKFSQCGCEDNNNTDWLNSVANNGSLAAKAVVNGTETLVVDGTLSNDTTAPGGSTGGAGSLSQQLAEGSGLWVVVAGVAYTIWAM